MYKSRRSEVNNLNKKIVLILQKLTLSLIFKICEKLMFIISILSFRFVTGYFFFANGKYLGAFPTGKDTVHIINFLRTLFKPVILV